LYSEKPILLILQVSVSTRAAKRLTTGIAKGIAGSERMAS
jgi:hypothetical protein